MGKKPGNFEQVIKLIAEKFKDEQYAIRGTSSLVLQGVDMNVDDIDIIGDKKTAFAANDLLSEFLKNEVKFTETEKFRSYFGSFLINEVDVEIYGEWQIKKKNEQWSEVYNASEDQLNSIDMDGIDVLVTTIETELKMFADMQRWNAFHKIKKQVDQKSQRDLF